MYHKISEYPNWNEKEVKIVRDEFAKGTSVKEIAKKVGRNEDAVVYRLIKIGILGYPQEEAENYGMLWSYTEKDQLLREYKEGIPIENIARIHRRSKNAILFRLNEYNAFDITKRSELNKYINKSNKVNIERNSRTWGDTEMNNVQEDIVETKIIPSR